MDRGNVLDWSSWVVNWWAIVITVMNIWCLQNEGYSLTSCGTISFLGNLLHAFNCLLQHQTVYPAVVQSLMSRFYFFPDRVKLLVQPIIKELFCISTASYIPMQTTPVSQHKCETDRWRTRSVRIETDSAPNTAQSQGTSYEMYRTYTIIMGMSAITSAVRVVLVGSLVTSNIMSSTASRNLTTLPNVQTTNLKYPYRECAVPNMP